MRNALDRSYRDRHSIHRLHRAVTLESDLYSGVRQKPLISKNVLDKVYNLEKISFAKWKVLLFFLYLSCPKECFSNICERLFINNSF